MRPDAMRFVRRVALAVFLFGLVGGFTLGSCSGCGMDLNEVTLKIDMDDEMLKRVDETAEAFINAAADVSKTGQGLTKGVKEVSKDAEVAAEEVKKLRERINKLEKSINSLESTLRASPLIFPPGHQPPDRQPD